MAKAKPEKRYDAYGEWRWMAEAEGYVMCRRYRGGVRAMSVSEWRALSRTPINGNADERRRVLQSSGWPDGS